jgi:hypothetical protein
LLAALDRKLLRLLRTRGHWPELERAALLYARAGENGLLWHGVGATGALLHRRRRPVYLRAMRVTALTLMANTVLKALVRRARPVLEELPALSPTLYLVRGSRGAVAGAAARAGLYGRGPDVPHTSLPWRALPL